MSKPSLGMEFIYDLCGEIDMCIGEYLERHDNDALPEFFVVKYTNVVAREGVFTSTINVEEREPK